MESGGDLAAESHGQRASFTDNGRVEMVVLADGDPAESGSVLAAEWHRQRVSFMGGGTLKWNHWNRRIHGFSARNMRS